jgi:hypothetical protein
MSFSELENDTLNQSELYEIKQNSYKRDIEQNGNSVVITNVRLPFHHT